MLKIKQYSDESNKGHLDFLFKYHAVSVYLSIVAGFGVLNLMYDGQKKDAVILWFVINTVFNLFKLFLFNKYKVQYKAHTRKHSFYLYLFVLFAFSSSVLWGICVYVFLPNQNDLELLVSFIAVIAILWSGTLSTSASSLLCSLTFIFPLFLGVLIRTFQFEYFYVSILLFLFSIFSIRLIIRSNIMVMQIIDLGVEQSKLVQLITIEKDNAEQANSEKSQFLSTTSKALKQPLNNMNSFLYKLRGKIKNTCSGDTLEILGHLDNSYNAFNELFETLLVTSRLDEGSIDATNERFLLTKVMQPLVSSFREQALTKGLLLKYQNSAVIIETDPILLSRILSNLIDNAIKYTEKGEIEITVLENKNTIDIRIMDTGVGVPEAEIDNIFNEYYQLSNKKRDRRKGVGLGLSIVKKMSEIINATIIVSSTLGEGSIFILRLNKTKKISNSISGKEIDLVHFNALDTNVVSLSKKC